MRFIRSIHTVVLCACLLTWSAAAAGRARQEQEVVIDADMTFLLELLSPLSTADNRNGDKFECKVLSPSQYAGAVVSGHVRKVKNAGKGKGKSELDLAFDTITLAGGKAGTFNAQITEVSDVENAADGGRADTEGTLRGKSRVKITAKRAAVGATAGAVIGGALGGLKGAAAGAAIGAGIGATTALAAEGPNLEFKEGTKFSVLTSAPPRRRRD